MTRLAPLTLAAFIATLPAWAQPAAPPATLAASRPFLGIFGADAAGDRQGAMIQEVAPNSPAGTAGLKQGDVITRMGDASIRSFEDLARQIMTKRPGDKISVTVMRDGKEQKFDVTLGSGSAAPAPPSDRSPRSGLRFRLPDVPGDFLPPGLPFSGDAQQPLMGVMTQRLDDALRQRLNVGNRQGVVVANVENNTPAAKAGLRDNDVILEADGKTMQDPQTFSTYIRSKKPGEKVALRVWRDGKEQTFSVTLASVRDMRFRPGPGMGPDGTMFPGMPRVEEMQRRIDQLEKRVRELEQKLNQSSDRR